MSIFKKQEPPKPRERPGPVVRSASTEAISIIGAGMSVVGDLTTDGTVRIEGHVKGTIRAKTAVVLGQGGGVEGHIITDDAVIGGTVSGSIAARARLELQSTCTVEGTIRARAERLKLEEGARFTGEVQMLEAETAAEGTPGEQEEQAPTDPSPPVVPAAGPPTESRRATGSGSAASGDDGGREPSERETKAETDGADDERGESESRKKGAAATAER